MSRMKVHKPKELWDGPRKVLSDWPGWDRWEEKNGEVCGLIGGDGEGELKGAEVLKDPGMLTGAELWNWLPPIKTRRQYAVISSCVYMHSAKQCTCISISFSSSKIFKKKKFKNTKHNSHAGHSRAALQTPLQRWHPEIIQVKIIQGWLWKHSTPRPPVRLAVPLTFRNL